MNFIKNKNRISYLFILGALIIPTVASASDISVGKILELTNTERLERGIKPLVVDFSLSQAAGSKSTIMIAKNYFDHFGYGISPWSLMLNSGYDYQIAGENLAMDFNTSEAMVQAWMNSPMHRQNILNPKYEDIGVGVVKGAFVNSDGTSHETIMVTQMFGKKKPAILSVTSKILSRVFGLF